MLRWSLAALALGWALARLLGCLSDPWSWLGHHDEAEAVLSSAELSRYTGAEGSPGLYLAVLGQVFDVQQGRRHYGPGGAYSFFSGKVVGRFYQENGVPTKLLEEVRALIDRGETLQAQEAERKQQFPPCNSEWSSAGGSRVWCSRQSGGITRDWSGVPRKLYEPGSSRSYCVCVKTEGLFPEQLASTQQNHQEFLKNPSLQEYEGCHPLSEWCALKE